jgi:hypothetical protein
MIKQTSRHRPKNTHTTRRREKKQKIGNQEKEEKKGVLLTHAAIER